MRTYWYGEGKVLRIQLRSVSLPEGAAVESALSILATNLGFPRLLDWSNRSDGGDGVLVYGLDESAGVATIPGRDDLEAESLVVWQHRGRVAGLLFARTIADLVTVLSTIAAYEKALCEITEYRERYVEIQARYASDASDIIVHEVAVEAGD